MLSLLFPRLSHRAVRKTFSFQLPSRLPSLSTAPQKLCPWPSWAHPGSLTPARETPLHFPVAGERKREWKKVQRRCLLQPRHKPQHQGNELEKCLRPASPAWGLLDPGPAIGTLYPQNRFLPARPFPWKRQSDSGLWDWLENTTVSSEQLGGARVSVGRRMGECRDRAELPAPLCLGMATPVQRGTHAHPHEVKPTREVTSQKSSLLTQV